jgi:hypothetical protein
LLIGLKISYDNACTFMERHNSSYAHMCSVLGVLHTLSQVGVKGYAQVLDVKK